MHDIIIIGGGLSGLINSILLSRAGLDVLLLEKNTFPFHRVCGEYVSNEVIPFLEAHDLFPAHCQPPSIHRLQISSTKGRSFTAPLDLGGFGISRYTFDQWLAQKSQESGTQILQGTRVINATFNGGHFVVETDQDKHYESRLVISAHGKRAKLDQTLSRPFIKEHSPYVGIKYHVKTDFPDDLIALHNFVGGYCGVSKIEDDKFNICYMVHRNQMRKHKNVKGLENGVLFRNPRLKSLFQNSDFLFKNPEVINEITFVKKEPVYEHLLMSGDAAGMITPLCGNGMAMAIHAASLLSEIIVTNQTGHDFDLPAIEASYTRTWNHQFATRLWAGRQIQGLFGKGQASELAVFTGKYMKPMARALIRQTHGEPFS
ncbi:MAG: FAD-dependent monooxygenase [Marinoscillum sp.]|uniref:NAD(P)/FAD-dependent oxidoreductase n=1 Tax=Marinoscillum sp. TaxID=2024838 RepID=UPI0032FA4A19